MHTKRDISKWDGLTRLFLELVSENNDLLKNSYIKSWYKVSKLFIERLLENKDLIKTDL